MASLGQDFSVRIGGDAPTMIAEAPAGFAGVCLISLDHDVQALAGQADPGTGLDVAEFLGLHAPVCPVILHTSNFDGRVSMHHRLRAGGWTVATVTEMQGPQPDDSIYDRTCASRGNLFFNAVNEVTRERAQRFLTDDHVERIVKANARFKDKPSYTRVAAPEKTRVKDCSAYRHRRHSGVLPPASM